MQKVVNKSFDFYQQELSKITLDIFQKMLDKIGDRQIIIPLSAGNDSRLIASVLKHLGVQRMSNVIHMAQREILKQKLLK